MRLFLYVVRDYFKYVLGTITICVFLFILFDFIHKSTKDFAIHRPSAELIAKFYWYQVPYQLVQALPIASLLASVITMVLLNRANEIAAMRAAGMGPLRIGAPLFIGGAMLSVSSYILSEKVIPKTSEKLHYIQSVLIEKEKEQELSPGVKWSRNDNEFLNFQEVDLINGKLTGVRRFEVYPNFRPKVIMDAKYASYNRANSRWTMEDITISSFKPDGKLDQISTLSSIPIKLGLDPSRMRKDRRTPNEMSLREISSIIDSGDQLGMDTLPYRVEFHIKLAYPLAAIVVSIIGLKFGYRSERSSDTAKGILIAFGIGISYWFILNAARSIGKRGDISPMLAGWVANFSVLAIALYDFWRERRAA
jgi:LPS export ABC transporter permease LptG